MMTDPAGRRGAIAQLSCLDTLEVPDLRPTIAARSTATSVTQTRRPVRARKVGLRAAIILVVAMLGLVAGRENFSENGQRVTVGGELPRREWVVRGDIDLPAVAADRPALIAPSGTSVWVATSGGTELALVEARPEGPALAREVLVGPVVDVAADASSAYVLTTTGELIAVSRTGAIRTIHRFAPLSGVGTSIAVAAGRVWIAGSSDGPLVSVGTADGSVTIAALTDTPSDLVAGGSTVWSIDPDRGSIVPIDARSGQVGTSIAVGGLGAAAADDDGIWLIEEAGMSLVRLRPGGQPEVVTALSSGADGVAISAGSVWVHDRFFVQSFTSDGRLQATVVPARSGRYSQDTLGTIAGSGRLLWVASPQQRRLVLIGEADR